MYCVECQIAQAKNLLQSVLLDTNFSVWQPVRALLKGAKAAGISREAMKIARRELGIVSISIDGEQHWGHPDRILGDTP